MSGVHDMGGNEDYGQIVFSEKEAKGEYDPFPESSSRGWSIVMAATLGVDSPEGRFRLARECIPQDLYLERPYADQWVSIALALMIDGGSLTSEEIEHGKISGVYEGEPPLSAEDVSEVYSEPYRSDRPLDARVLFAAGDAVKAKLIDHDGHTRMPGYVRGHSGEIHRYLGAHIFQDASAHFHGEHPVHLYSVRFEAADLWPESKESKDAVFVDLWEAHLEPVN